MGTQAAWVPGLKEDSCPFEGQLSCLGDHFTVHRAFLPQSLPDILQVSWNFRISEAETGPEEWRVVPKAAQSTEASSFEHGLCSLDLRPCPVAVLLCSLEYPGFLI